MQKFQNAEVRIPYTYVQSYQITRLSLSSSNRVDRELNHTLYQKLRSTGQQFRGTSLRSRFFFVFCFVFFQIVRTAVQYFSFAGSTTYYTSLRPKSLDPGQFSGHLIYSTVH